MIDFIPPRPEPELLGGPLTPTVVTIPHVASAVPAARLRRHEKAATAIALRWGLDAASSLLAALDSAATSPSYAVVVREFGPLAWVEHGKTMMTPLFLTPLFVHRGAWVGWPTGQGLKTAIAEAADACLAEPERVLEAICEVTRARVLESPELVQQQHPDAPPSVLALAQPVRVVGREVHALIEYQGAVGPLVLDVDTAKLTLRPLLQKPWQPPVLL